MFVRWSGAGLTVLRNILVRLRSSVPESGRTSSPVSDSDYDWLVLLSFSVCCPPTALLGFPARKKKKSGQQLFAMQVELSETWKKCLVSCKRRVRVSSGGRTCCWRRHLCGVSVEPHVPCGSDIPTAFQEAFFPCLLLKTGVGYGCILAGGECGEADSPGPLRAGSMIWDALLSALVTGAPSRVSLKVEWANLLWPLAWDLAPGRCCINISQASFKGNRKSGMKNWKVVLKFCFLREKFIWTDEIKK